MGKEKSCGSEQGYMRRGPSYVSRASRTGAVWTPPAANMASYGLLSAMKRIGRVQRGVRRAFLVRPRHSLSTRELLAWSHPRLARAPLRERRNACRAVGRAAEQLAIRVGRRWPDGLLWRARDYWRLAETVSARGAWT